MWSYAGKMGLTGGILQVPASCKEGEMKKGLGVTIYHFVESIEKVLPLFPIFFLLFVFYTYPLPSYHFCLSPLPPLPCPLI